jgi:anti-sigma B factor antagonist
MGVEPNKPLKGENVLMKVTTRTITHPPVAILELAGRFDAYEEPQVKQWLDKEAAVASARLIVNLAQVNFVDSTALATLVQGMKHCRQQNGDLYLCHLQQSVRIIFELTRLDKAFEIFLDEAEAIAAFTN